MSRSLGTLTLDLIAKTGGFTAGMTAAERAAEKANQKIRKETAATLDAVYSFAAKTAAGAALVTTAFAAMAKQSADAIDQQADMAAQLGATYAGLNNVALAAQNAGVDLGTINGAVLKLNDSIGNLAAGATSGGAAALDRLGLSAEMLSRMDVDEKIATITGRIREMIPEAEQASVAVDLFGKTAGAAVMQISPERLEQAAKHAKMFGLALSEIEADKVGKLNDAFDVFGMAIRGLGTQLAVQFAPMFDVLSDKVQDSSGKIRDFGTIAFSAFKTTAIAAAYVANVFDSVSFAAYSLYVTYKGLEAAALNLNAALTKTPDEDSDIYAIKVFQDRTLAAQKATQEFSEARVKLAGWARSPLPTEDVRSFFDEVQARANERTITIPVVKMSYDGQDSGVPAPSGANTAMFDAGTGVTVPMPDVSMTHDQILTQRYEAEVEANERMMELKRSAWADEIAGETATAEATAEAWSKVTDAKQKEYQKNADFFQKGLDSIARGNSKASKVARALNLADSLYDIYLATKVAAVNAYAFGSKIGGPVVGAAFAGVALAFGASMASEAISASRGGTRSSAGAAPSGIPEYEAPGQATAGRTPATVDVTVIGRGLPSWEQVGELMNMIGDRVADSGGRLGRVRIVTE